MDFLILANTLDWLPAVLRIPCLAVLALTALMAAVKLASAILSIFSAVLGFINPFK